MTRYNIISATRINKDGEDYNYYQLILADDKGNILLHKDEETGKTASATVNMSYDHIVQLFKERELDVDTLLPIHVQSLLNNGATLLANVEFKTKGETFIATEFSTISNDNGETWEKAVKGEEYMVQQTGFRLDYEAPIKLNFDIMLATQFQLMMMKAQ